MPNDQISELLLEREFLIEQMRRYLQVQPEEAESVAVEIYEAYLNLNARYVELTIENDNLQRGIRTRIEAPPFWGAECL